MTTAQKVIKYGAIALAFSIIVGIFSSIIVAFSYITDLFTPHTYDDVILQETNVSAVDGESLNIELSASDLRFEIGEEFSIKTDSEHIKIEEFGNEIKILEKHYRFSFNHHKGNVLVTVPEDFKFSDVYIKTGAGKITIDRMITDKLKLALGAGEVKLSDIEVKDKMKLSGGVGEIKIKDSVINNLEAELGVGEFNLNALILGKSEIEAGIGEVNLNIQNNVSEYEIEVEKGIGSIRIDGKKVKSKEHFGNGFNKLDVSGGIGEVNINFLK